MKFGRIKRQHGRVGGLDEILDRIVKNCPHVSRIVPGRIKVRRGHTPPSFKVQYPTDAGLKCQYNGTASEWRVSAAYFSAIPLPKVSSGWEVRPWGPPDRQPTAAQWATRRGPMIVGPTDQREPADTWVVFGRHCACINTVAKWSPTI